MINQKFLPLFVLVCTMLFKATAQPPIDASTIRTLDSIATQDVPAGAPGIATAIIRNGKNIYQKCSGFANLQDSALITPATRFNLASNGKQFTALAVLLLQHQQKLDIEDDIRKYFPQLFTEIKAKISIKNLLTHTSGIRDVYDLLTLQGITWWQTTMSNQDIIRILLNQRQLNFTPGSEYLYSNSNYILLAAIIEKASRESFYQYTKKMLESLGMPNSSFETNHLAIAGPIARPYFNFDRWTTYDWTWDAAGDGNFFSTLADQAKWESIVQGKFPPSFPAEVIAASQKLIDKKFTDKYGYGLEFGEYKKLPYRFHEGATGAWKATVIRFDDTLSIITLTNTGKSIPAMQTRQMADVLLRLKNDNEYFVTRPANIGQPVSDEDLVGTYSGAGNFTFIFEKRSDGIYLKRFGRNDVKLEREAANILHQANDPDFKQEFTTDEQGNLQVTAYYITHAPYSLVKKKADWTGFQANSIEGIYFSAELNLNMTVSFKQGRNYNVAFAGQDPMEGVLITPSQLVVGSYSIDLSAEKASLNGDRIRKVEFIKLPATR